jgi:hypothetical protein
MVNVANKNTAPYGRGSEWALVVQGTVRIQDSVIPNGVIPNGAFLNRALQSRDHRERF